MTTRPQFGDGWTSTDPDLLRYCLSWGEVWLLAKDCPRCATCHLPGECPIRPATMAAMAADDLPAPDELFTPEAWLQRWPTATEKAELYFGVLVYAGQFDQRDVETAQRAYPGRRVLLNTSASLEIHPAGDGPLLSIFHPDNPLRPPGF